MEQYIVSARKYRPRLFEDVVGQQGVTTTLKNALRSGHLAQSFLFCGPRGVGKTTCARILAKAINCLSPTSDFEPCGTCDSCKSFEQNTSFNIHELDAASNNSVDDIRELVGQVRVPPQAGKYKVYIIDEVHMLSSSAFNAFLKTLEEPPAYAIFILATTEKHKIIPTILSRCQIYEFNRITVADTVKHLQGISAKENIESDVNALHIISQKADGALRDALSMFDRLTDHVTHTLTLDSVLTNLNILDYDYYFKFTDALLATDISGTMLLFDEVLRKGFDGDLLTEGLSEHFRNLLMCKDARTANLLEASGVLRERYMQQATVAPSGFLLSAINLSNQCELHYKASKNKRLHVELCLIKISQLPNILSISPEHFSEVKKNSDGEVALLQPLQPKTESAIQQNASTSIPSEEKKETPQPVVSENKPTETVPTVKTKKVLGFNSELSLASVDKEIEQKQKEQELQKAEAGFFEVHEEVEQDMLNEIWKLYTEILTTSKPNVASVFALNHPVAADGAIKITVNALVQKETLEEEKKNFLHFLKEKTGIQAHIIVELNKEAESAKRILSGKEKLEHMVQKNPHVLTLLKEFGLKEK